MCGALALRSELGRHAAAGRFWWAAGIEDTFITAPHPVTGRTLDEYELTDHYRRWADDIDLLASLGIGAARYGLPWHRIEPRPGAWAWEHADGPINRLLDKGIAPQIDLVHYGLPPWMEGAFLNPDYPQRVAEYAARVAERYRGRVHWYTPLNEPRITAWYCGRLGWWPPFQQSLSGFVRVLLAICRGIRATVSALHGVDPEIVDYHVDATDLFEAAIPDLSKEADLRQSLVFLALDLVTGRVGETHPLRRFLRAHGIDDRAIDSFADRPVKPTIIGLNLYPMYTAKRLVRDGRGRLRVRMHYAEAALVERLARLYHARYGVPLAISETATVGSVARRLAWLEGSVEACRRLRAEGVPITGYTWWPLFSLVAWAYRQGRRPVTAHLLDMGLYDLARKAGDGYLERRPTPVADRFRALAQAGTDPVGVLAHRAPTPSL